MRKKYIIDASVFKLKKYEKDLEFYSIEEICGRLAHIGFNIPVSALKKQLQMLEYKYEYTLKGTTRIFEDGMAEEALLNFCIERWENFSDKEKIKAREILGNYALRNIEKKARKKAEEREKRKIQTRLKKKMSKKTNVNIDNEER